MGLIIIIGIFAETLTYGNFSENQQVISKHWASEVWTKSQTDSPMKYVATLHMPVPKMKFFMRFGMSVKGMQKTHSIRSLTARDSRNRFVTVRMRRFRTRTVMMRLFPMKLRRKMSTYRTIRTDCFMSDTQVPKKERKKVFLMYCRDSFNLF